MLDIITRDPETENFLSICDIDEYPVYIENPIFALDDQTDENEESKSKFNYGKKETTIDCVVVGNFVFFRNEKDASEFNKTYL